MTHVGDQKGKKSILIAEGGSFIAQVIIYHKKVQVGKDQEKAQSEKDSLPKTEVGKKQTNNQVLIP